MKMMKAEKRQQDRSQQQMRQREERQREESSMGKRCWLDRVKIRERRRQGGRGDGAGGQTVRAG